MDFSLEKNKINSVKILLVIVWVFLSCQFSVYAQAAVDPGTPTTLPADDSGPSPTAPTPDSDSGTTPPLSVELENPLKNVDTIEGLLVAILNIVMILMIPIIVFFIIYSGFKYVVARGNASQVEEASQSLLYAIIGGVLILGAIAIADIIKSIVDAF